VTRINYARPLAFKSLFNYKRRCYPSAVHDTFHARALARSRYLSRRFRRPTVVEISKLEPILWRRLPTKNIDPIVRLFMTAHGRLKYRGMRAATARRLNLRRRVASALARRSSRNRSRSIDRAIRGSFPRRDVRSRARKPRTWRVITPCTRIRLFFVRLINTRTPVFLRLTPIIR